MGSAPGGFAEYAVTDAGRVNRIPGNNMTYEQAACFPVALQTMHNAVVTAGRLKRGETLLIQGASSGVGLMGMQIGKLMGASLVLGTSSNAKRRAGLKDYGCDVAIDTGKPDWPEDVKKATGGKGVNLIVDMVSAPVAIGNLEACALLGRIVNVGRLGGTKGEFNFDMHALKRIDYIGVTFRTRTPEEVREIVKAMRADLWPAVEAGKLTLPIYKTFKLADIVEALAEVAAGNQTISTIAGNSSTTYSGDGGPATSAQLDLGLISGVAVDAAGNYYIADTDNHRIRKVAATTGIITTVAGNGTAGFSGDGGLATSAELDAPEGVAVDGSGNLFIADTFNRRIREVAAATGNISTFAGGGATFGDNGPATSAQLSEPSGVAVDSSGNVYIADAVSNRIRKVASSIITTAAGNGTPGFSGDGGQATGAQLNQPLGVAVDSAGNFYIADALNYRIRKVTTTGHITTVAGNGTQGYSGDGGQATSATFDSIDGVALDASGNLYIAALSDENVRKVTAATGIISTLAGSGTSVVILPSGVAAGRSGQVFIADDYNSGVTQVNDSGAPAPQITPGNARSVDHLTFNLLIQKSSGSPAGVAGHRSASPGLAPGGSNVTSSVGGTVQFTQTLVRDASAPTATDVQVGSTLPPTWTFTGCTSDSGGTCSSTGDNTITVTYPVLDTRNPNPLRYRTHLLRCLHPRPATDAIWAGEYMARPDPAEGSHRSYIVHGCATGHEHAGCNRGGSVFIPPAASGETRRNHIPGGQLGQPGEVARRLGRISHNGLPGMRPSRWPRWCQRGALIRACAADPGAVG